MIAVSIGQLVYIVLPFLDDAGAASDPDTISVRVADQQGNETTYDLTGGGVVKESTGIYHVALTPATAGLWSWHVQSTGTPTAADDGQFLVLPALA